MIPPLLGAEAGLVGGALTAVGGLTAVGTVLVSAIGVVRRPEPARYRQVWLKFGVHMGLMAALLLAGGLGTWGLVAVATTIAVLGWRELLRAVAARNGEIACAPTLVALGAAGVLGAPVLAAMTASRGVPPALAAVAAGAIATWVAFAWPILATRRPPPLHGVLATAFGGVLITTPLALLPALLGHGYGPFAFYVLVLMAIDGFSEGFGRLLGKRALWPELSPAKTVGGTVGGLLSCLVLAPVLHHLVPRWPLYAVGLVAAGVFLTAALGDLLASAIKRQAGIKDFGTVLPAHGGVLDRFDSLLFSVPAFYAATWWLT